MNLFTLNSKWSIAAGEESKEQFLVLIHLFHTFIYKKNNIYYEVYTCHMLLLSLFSSLSFFHFFFFLFNKKISLISLYYLSLILISIES